MEESLAFSQELPNPYSGGKFYTESTPLVEHSAGSHISDVSSTGAAYRRLKPRVYGILAASALGSFLWGYNLSVIAGAMLLINEHFHLDVLWHGLIVSIMIGGATVGAATAGMLNDKLGRWKVMMMSAILFCVAALVMAFSFSKVYLTVGRAISGIGIGKQHNQILYICVSRYVDHLETNYI